MSVRERIRAFAQPHLNVRFEILKYLGPGLLVTVGFIDPGNWAANIAAGSTYGYTLLWMVTLSTIMLIILQHNAARLGIATGLCLSEAATRHLRPWASRTVLGTAVAASVSTALAEIMGGAIALNMLFHIPLKLGSIMMLGVIVYFLFGNSYKRIEKWIFGFVSLIGLAFLFELCLMDIEWTNAAVSWVAPRIPFGSMAIVMSVLGAVVMPHNLFLHSEIIQSRQWNLKDPVVIKRQIRYEFLDTLVSMLVGWGINSAMLLVAAAAFFARKIEVTDLAQAEQMLRPLVGKWAAIVFALALLVAGVASSVTAGMAGGSIFAGMFGEPYNVHDRHTRTGIAITLIAATAIIFVAGDPFKTLVLSQMALSMQLPITVFLQLRLTTSRTVMGEHASRRGTAVLLWVVAAVVTLLNLMLLIDLCR